MSGLFEPSVDVDPEEPQDYDGEAGLQRVRDAVAAITDDDGTPEDEVDWRKLADNLANAVLALDEGLVEQPWRLPEAWRDEPEPDIY